MASEDVSNSGNLMGSPPVLQIILSSRSLHASPSEEDSFCMHVAYVAYILPRLIKLTNPFVELPHCTKSRAPLRCGTCIVVYEVYLG